MSEFDKNDPLYDEDLYRILKFELPEGESEISDRSHENKMKIEYIWEENTDIPKIKNVYNEITCFRCKGIKKYEIPRDELIINRLIVEEIVFILIVLFVQKLTAMKECLKLIIDYVILNIQILQ